MLGSLVRSRPTSVPLQLGLLGLLLAAGVVAGVMAAFDRLPMMVILAPVACIALVLSVRYVEFGLCLLPLVAVGVPFTIGSGTQSPIVAALPFAAVLLGLGLVRAVRARDWSSGALVTLPSVMLMVVWVIAYLWSNVELDPLVVPWPTFWLVQLGAVGIVLISVGVLLLAMSVGRSERWIEVTTWAFITCGAITLIGFFLGLTREPRWPFETKGLWTMWVIALSFGQAMFNDRLSRPLRVGLAVHALLWELKATIFEGWFFSGWLPGLVVLVVITFFRSRRLFVAAGVCTAVFCAINFDALVVAIWGQTLDKGDLTRFGIWEQSFDLVSRHLLLGTGPAGYSVYFWSLYMGSAYSLSTHNNFMDVLMETGVVGTAIFVWFLVALVAAGWQARRYWVSGFNGGFAQGAFAGLLGLLVAMNQGDWFIPFVYNQTIAGFRYTVHSWVFLGFLVSLALIRNRQSAASDRNER